MEPKANKCKGTGKAINHGCGQLSKNRQYGLCRDGNKCFFAWLYSTDEGSKVIKSYAIKAKKEVAETAENDKRKKKKELKESIKTPKDYKKDLQDIINPIVRLIDNNKGCISCDHGWGDNWTRQKHAGHRLSVGSTPELRFNVLNIYLQCSICNNWKSGNEREYDKGLINHYSQEQLDAVRNLRIKYPSLHITIPELKEAIIKAKKIKKDILKGKDFSRAEINEIIGIYT